MSIAAQLERAARQILPGDVAVSVLPIGDAAILPDEARFCERAVPARRAEFASGRLALRQAIARTGFHLPADRPILPRADRRPDLPEGLNVSLAHGGGICIAVATRRVGHHLGIDLEPLDADQPDDLKTAIQPYRTRRGPDSPLLAFSAKEALFKRQFPVTGRLLDFCDISLIVADDGRFAACLRGAGLLHGAWRCVGGFYLTATAGPVRAGE